jgi:predicted metal-dependent enzyme (double-stranded beta helix superfamily)
MTDASASYTVRDLADEVRRLVKLHGEDGPKLLEGLREPIQKVLAQDLSKAGVKREGNHIDNSKYLYYDGQMSITFDHMPKGKFIPPHDHGVWEAMAIYSGRLKHVVYERRDDGSKEGYADLNIIDDRVLEKNDLAIVAQPAEIHSFTALTDDTISVTIVGGKYKEDRHYFKPEEKTYVRRTAKQSGVKTGTAPTATA